MPNAGEKQGVPVMKEKEVPGWPRSRRASSQSRLEQDSGRGFQDGGAGRTDGFDYTENYI